MKIAIFFDYFHKGARLALRIDGIISGLKTESYLGKKMFLYELEVLDNGKLSIGLVSLTGKAEIPVYIIETKEGKALTTKIFLEDGQKETVINLDVKNFNIIIGNDKQDGDQGFNKKNYFFSKKIRSRNFGSKTKFKDSSEHHNAIARDYSYYEKQIPREKLLTPVEKKLKNTTVEVFYATDRKQKQKRGRLIFTNERGDLALGRCIVSVPANKAKGNLPLPPWYLFGLSRDENKYILIKNLSVLDAQSFFQKINDKVQSSPERDVFLFVHGFNVSFSESITRAAQIATDIGFHGAPIVYSWPSRNGVLHYAADESTTTGYSVDNFIQILKDVRKATNADRIHIIAHSMGNRIMVEALQTLVDQGFNKDFLFNQIILAAPDIDAEVFVKYIAPKLVQSSERVTLYASQNDKALWFSGNLHGRIQRVGAVTEKIAVIQGIDTIDASSEKIDLLGHGYFAESKALVDDIFYTTRFNTDPEKRNLRQRNSGESIYWEFW